jgi:T5orf172 domain
MRGWVYVITNETMPGVVKVGHTLKDPDLRASELSHTGSAGPYLVEYEVMVRDPRNVEQRAHLALKGVLQHKEWFRCSVGHAVEVIRRIVGNNIILEDFRTELTSSDSKMNEGSSERESPMAATMPNTTAGVPQVGTYGGNCKHCGKSFKVTLTRGESAARCPRCYRMNDASKLKRQEFIL